MDSLRQDLRYAFRMLLGNPGLTVVAALSLALGIAATTTIFSLVNSMLLKPLPVSRPGELIRIGSTLRGEGFYGLSYLEYIYYRDNNQVFSNMLAHQPTELSLSAGSLSAEMVWGEVVSGNYFSALAIEPRPGRGFLPKEDQTPGTNPVIVISHDLWQRRFNSDPDLIGSTLKLNGHPFTVVGVAPDGFRGTFPGFSCDIWVPVLMQAQAMPGRASLDDRDDRFLMLIGRLKPGVTMGQAEAAMRTLARQLEEAYPDTNKERSLALTQATGVHPFIAKMIKLFLSLLMAIVGLVLAIACANVASLLLARASARRREIAVRLALGASRLRLVRQLLTEAVLLALVGGAAGLVIAYWTTGMLAAYRPPTNVPVGFDLTLDGRVYLFTLLVSIVTGVVFGLAPALQASRADLIPALKDERGLTGYRKSRLRSALVIAQVALSLLLLIGAALLARSLNNSRTIDPGFDPENVFVMQFDPQLIGYDLAKGRRFYKELVERVSALPGVQSASVAGWVPLGDRGDQARVTIEGQAPPSGRQYFSIDYNPITNNYFSTMRIQFLAGRDITEQDREGAPGVAIINETMARRFFSGEDPLGKRIKIAGETSDRQIVGVVKDGKYSFLGEAPRPYLYVPLIQYNRLDLTLHVRASGDIESMIPIVRREVEALDENIPAYNAKPITESMAFSLVPARVAGTVLAISGLVALILASVGIYGLISYGVSQRTHEIGIRMALGAQTSDILRMIVGRGLGLALAGEAIGVIAALAMTRVLSSFLYGITATDPLTFAAVSLALAAVALTASYIPARRAARFDPAVALRHE